MTFLVKDAEVRTVWIAGAVFTLLYLLVYVFEIGGYTGITWISDLATVVIAGAVAVLCFMLWRAYTAGETARAIWGFLLAGFGLWALGEFIWTFYELVLQQDIPYPSLADVVWVIGYLPLFAALWIRYRSARVTVPGGFWIALALFTAAVLGALYFVLWPIFTYTEYERTVEKVLDLLYPLGDLLLLFGALVIVFTLRGGRLAVPWLIMAVGLAVMSLSDLLFSYASWNELYFPDQHVNLVSILADVPYTVSYLLIAIGAFVQARLEGLL